MELQELVRKAKRGDEAAFYELMQLHKVRLYRIALSYLKNSGDAVEALQEVTYRAYRSIRKLKEPQYFTTWLTRILLNYCNDELKKRKRLLVSDDLISLMGTEHQSSWLEVEDVIAKLDAKTRQVIELKYVHDFKIKEIAEILDCPEGTVKTWLHKGLQELRGQLEDKGGLDYA
ncbi:sigma-70 family RNA polymerase sigma factor [Mesobacillus thioparans]|uniref:sigma-70 family RNA polymerase sigma factor n=1 Tax=Mesobacillus thioparans TaxID=370439 RepID=UPI0039F0F26F